MRHNGVASISSGLSQGNGAAPSNQGMRLTIKSFTPFVCAKAAPLFPAADARCLGGLETELELECWIGNHDRRGRHES